MTSLFRQGVETVCKGEREKECASPPCRRKSRWGWGWGEGLNTELWGGIKRKNRSRAVSGSQSWQPGQPLCFHVLQPPTAPRHMTRFFRPALQAWFLRGRSAKLKSNLPCLSLPPGKVHLEFSPALPPRQGRIILGCWNGTWFLCTSHPQTIKRPFPTPWVIEVPVIQKRSQQHGTWEHTLPIPFKKKKSHPRIWTLVSWSGCPLRALETIRCGSWVVTKSKVLRNTFPETHSRHITKENSDCFRCREQSSALRRINKSWQVPLESNWSWGNRTSETTSWTDVIILMLLPQLLTPAGALKILALIQKVGN